MIHVAPHFLTGTVSSKQVAESAHIVLIYFFLGFMYLFFGIFNSTTPEKPYFIIFNFSGMIAAKLDKNASPLKRC